MNRKPNSNGSSSRNARRGESAPRKRARARRKNNNDQARREQPMQQAPVSQSRISTIGSPSINSLAAAGDARVRVRHKEFIADVLGAEGFNVYSFPVNAGLATTFPWLSKIATNYESYQFSNLCFHYEPVTSTSSVGSIILAMDFDAADAAPINKIQAMSMHRRSRSTPWQEQKMAVDGADLRKFGPQRYVRAGAIQTNQDIKTYDIGNLFLCIDNATEGVLGELHVSYDIMLMTPQYDETGLSAKITGGGTVSDTQFYGDDPVVVGDLPVTATNNSLYFQQVGGYLVTMNCTGVSIILPTIASSTASVTDAGGTVNGTGNSAFQDFLVDVSAVGQRLFTDWSGSSSILTSGVRVARYNYSLG